MDGHFIYNTENGSLTDCSGKFIQIYWSSGGNLANVSKIIVSSLRDILPSAS